MVLPISRRDGFDQNVATEGGHATEDSLIMDTANISRFNPDIQNLSIIEPGLPSKKIIKHKSKLSKVQHQINQNYGVSPRDLSAKNMNRQLVDPSNVQLKGTVFNSNFDTNLDHQREKSQKLKAKKMSKVLNNGFKLYPTDHRQESILNSRTVTAGHQSIEMRDQLDQPSV